MCEGRSGRVVADRLLLWSRELGRAARLATTRSAFLVASCILAVGGVVVGVWLSSWLHPWKLQAVYGALLTVAMFGILWIGFFIWHFATYRLSRFEDKDWTATHDFTDDGGVILRLDLKPGRDRDLKGVPELGVKNRGKWTWVPDHPYVQYRGKLIWCQLNYVPELKLQPGGFYEVRWFRRSQGWAVEVTRETFQLKNRAFDTLARSESRSG